MNRTSFFIIWEVFQCDFDLQCKLGHQEDKHQHPNEMAGINSQQETELRELWEIYGMEKNFAELITEKCKAGFPEARIRRCLRILGLKGGVLTEKQVTLS